MRASLGVSRFRQSGLSLIELMIAVVLGLLLVAGATRIFLANTQAFRLQDNISSTQEAGRLGLEMLLADLRRAGMDYSVNPSTGDRLYSISMANGTAKADAAIGLLADSDEVTVTYTVPAEIGSMSDCEGVVVNAGGTIRNRYFIKKDTNPDVAALFCEGNAAAGGTALVRGVESFQLQYGVVAPTDLRADLTQKKSNGFASAERYVLGASGVGEQRVASIRVGLLLRSEVGIQGLQAPAADIAVLDSNTVTKGVLSAVKINSQFPVHRFFTGMAALRNDAYAKF